MNHMNEPQKRIEIVGSQYEIEGDVARADKGTANATFFLPTMATPFFFNPDDIYQDQGDGLFKLKEGAKVPDGLMPLEKANDPAQLSTVLARVLSVQAMFDAGVSITIVAVNAGRPRVDDPTTNVLPADGSLLERYSGQFKTLLIAEKGYDRIKDSVGAANYEWLSKGTRQFAAFFASQICVPDSEVKFDKCYGELARPYLLNVKSALASLPSATQPQSRKRTSPENRNTL
ncbi:MAG: hypothetical protein PHS57_02300 [Alphaproteobacteria bacterium]|nr:hypothetical protein [Alphaproteobacteria bacterium]